MKASQLPITIGTLHRVETTTDAYQLISNFDQLERYVAQYGDVSITFDHDAKVWRVPAFSKQIEKYTAYKAEECAKWGSE